jgi:hypothetical protein
VLLGDVADELLDEDGLADARTAEQPDLSTLGVRRQQVDHLDASFEHLGRRPRRLDAGGLTMDRVVMFRVNRTHLVHRLADHVQHAAQGLRTHRHFHRMAETLRFHAAHEAFGRL